MSFTPPRDNLPPEARPWGRWVTSALLKAMQWMDQFSAALNNQSRIQNAAIDGMQSSLTELYQRQTRLVTRANITTASFGATTVTASGTLQLPRPADGSRIARVVISYTPTASSQAEIVLLVTLSLDGVVFSNTGQTLGTDPASAVKWTGVTMQDSVGYDAKADSGGLISISFSAMSYLSVLPRTVSLENIRAEVTFAQKTGS